MRKLYFILVSILIAFATNAQDPNFSQFFNNPLYYNPGNAGINGGLHLSGSYRSLWSPIPSKFNTLGLAADAQAINKIGLGTTFYSDIEGEGFLRTNALNFYYSYRPIETRNLRLQLGASGGVVNKNIDYDNLVFSDQLDEVFGEVGTSQFNNRSFNNVLYPDFGAGAVVRFNNPNHRTKDYQMVTTVGASMLHLTSPRDAFLSDEGRLPRKFVFHANTSIQWNGVVYMPGLIYERQSNLETFQMGTNIMKYPIYTGFWFRNRNYKLSFQEYDSFIFNIGAYGRLNETRIKFTYSFDFTVSRLKTASMGSHEISFIYHIKDAVIFKGWSKKQQSKNKSRFLECVDS
jgi:type IX secretion system PorP/SprF family membrane protein